MGAEAESEEARSAIDLRFAHCRRDAFHRLTWAGWGGFRGFSPLDVDIRIVRHLWRFLGLRNDYILSSTSHSWEILSVLKFPPRRVAKRQVIPREDGSIAQIGIDLDETGDSLN